MGGKTIDLEDTSFWKGLTKKQKRSVKVQVGNRTVRALDWIDEQDKKLPVCYGANDLKVNHKGKMRDLFMSGGVKDVNLYIDTVNKLVIDQSKLAVEILTEKNKQDGESNSTEEG